MPRGGARPNSGPKPGYKRPPSAERRSLTEAALAHTELAIQTLVTICKDGVGEAARVTAACALLDRGHGKPIDRKEVGDPGDFAKLDETQLNAELERAAADAGINPAFLQIVNGKAPTDGEGEGRGLAA